MPRSRPAANPLSDSSLKRAVLHRSGKGAASTWVLIVKPPLCLLTRIPRLDRVRNDPGVAHGILRRRTCNSRVLN